VKLCRIPRPSWSRAPRIKVTEISAEIYSRICAARELILKAVDLEVASYLTDPELVFSSFDEFPSTQRLTGEYYLSDESYFIDPSRGLCRICIGVRCLGYSPEGKTQLDDYLGLDVWLECSPECRTFCVYRNTDSSVI
jgi:hypothetical protein